MQTMHSDNYFFFTFILFNYITKILHMYSVWVISYFLIRKLHISRIAGVCILGILDIDKGTLFSWTNLYNSMNNAYEVHACTVHKLIWYQGLTMYIIIQMRKTKHFTKLRRKHVAFNLIYRVHLGLTHTLDRPTNLCFSYLAKRLICF